MFETDKQRRWWFATHPEYSGGGGGRTGKGHGKPGRGGWPPQPAGAHRPDKYGDTSPGTQSDPSEDPAKKAFINMMMKAGWSRQWAESRWRLQKLNESIARTTATAISVRGLIADAMRLLTGGGRVLASGIVTRGPKLRPKGTPERGKIDADAQRGTDVNKAEGVKDAPSGWKRGDDPLAPTSKGTDPAWPTQQRRYWKNESEKEGATEKWGAENVDRMKRGLAPQEMNRKTGELESRELHHSPVPRRDGGKEFIAVRPEEHAELDPYRRLKKR